MKKKQSEESIKSFRQLYLYNKLMNGGVADLHKEAEILGVTERTLHRDIADLNSFLAAMSEGETSEERIFSDRKANGYRISRRSGSTMSGSEIIAVCRILMDSRVFSKEDIVPIIDRIIGSCAEKENYDAVYGIVSNELYHYIEPNRKKNFTDFLWYIASAVNEHRYLNVVYEKTDGSHLERKLMPAEIMFSEHCFYLVTYVYGGGKDINAVGKDDVYPTIYRIDRIVSCNVLDERFHVPFKDRFEESEFRRRVVFNGGGTLKKVTFLYKGTDPETILDKFPTAAIMSRSGSGFVISAEVFGNGIDTWIKSQGDLVLML